MADNILTIGQLYSVMQLLVVHGALCFTACHDCSMAHNLLTSFQLYCVIVLLTPSVADIDLFAEQQLV